MTRRLTRRPRRASQAKDHFLAVLSHELRTPLSPVPSGLTLLDAESGLSPRGRDIVEVARRNVELEARLIDDLDKGATFVVRLPLVLSRGVG